MKKVAIVFGTRPEAIKVAPLIHLLKETPNIECSIVVTGQHKEMLDQVLEVFSIVPDLNLSVMRENQTLSGLTARLLDGIDAYLNQSKPDFIFAQGDTTTAFVASLVSFYHKIPFGHIEAGLRTHDLTAPWPEEANRTMTTRIATLHFAPTAHAFETLISEGVPKEKVFLTGNTIVDALRSVEARLPTYEKEVVAALPAVLQDQNVRMVLITGHRRENFDGGLERVCSAIARLAAAFPDVQFVYPVHLNPNVQKAVQGALANIPNVHLLPPLSYIPFVWLMRNSFFIITDSGGIQEEAPSFGKPVLVTRSVTERPEGIATGNARLVGTNTEHIVDIGRRLLTDPSFYDSMAQAVNPYGDGTAAQKICNHTVAYLNHT